ncbi:MAG: signal peptidase II [Actinomycetia bacterium]|nr:signal peptidase II [Actinomycetes bacterium]
MGVILLDQLTKWWAVSTLDTRTIDLVWTLRLNLTFNTGAAFSRGSGLGPFIAVAAVVVTIVLMRTSRLSTSVPISVTLGMVVGGAVGNLGDRVFRTACPLGPCSDEGRFLGGAVIDFIDFQWWPVFNVADIGVVVGAILLAFLSSREPHESGPPQWGPT